MVQRTYHGLGPPDSAVRDFTALRPHVVRLWALRIAVGTQSPDAAAVDIALDSLKTAAFHFTRRPHFYGSPDVAVVTELLPAASVFEALRPYAVALRTLQGRCRPLGRDWQALNIALQGLETTAFHFTRVPQFYGSRGDSAGVTRALPETGP